MRFNELVIGVIIGAFLVVAVVAVLKFVERPVSAQTVDQGSICVAATGTISTNRQVLWLILPQERRILVYDLGGEGREARFIAARDYQYDAKIQDYAVFGRDQNWVPTVKEVKKKVEEAEKKRE